MTGVPLSNATLDRLDPRVAVPSYDRSALSPAVVHMSVGSFHRSHQAMYFDALAEQGGREWGLVGVGLQRPEMREVLTAQDGLYTVVARSAARDEARVVGAITGYLFAPEDGAAVLAALADRRTRVVTLTITAAAYSVDSAALDYVVEALDRRRRAGLPGLTVLSCDNVPDNGAMTRAVVVGVAARRDIHLGAWIERNVSFPSAMVDRITPKTTTDDRDWVEREFGVHDRWPVITEPFTQWIIEDSFANGRPPLDEVGVQFVADVRPYSLMKTRLLNASHCALGYLGYLAGYRRTDEAIRDDAMRAYIARLMDDEVTPLLEPVPGIDVEAYKRSVLARLSNPKIGDQLARLCRNGSGKMPHHVITSIRTARDEGRPHPLLTLAVAAWFWWLRGVDEQGEPVPVDDPMGERLHALALAGGNDPRPLLGERSVFGTIGEDAGFVSELEHALTTLDRDGARSAVAATAGAGVLAA